MSETPLVTIALVLTITAFFKTQFGITNKWIIWLCAAVVLALLVYLPVVIAMFPEFGVWLTPLLTLITVVLAAGGTADIIKSAKAG